MEHMKMVLNVAHTPGRNNTINVITIMHRPVPKCWHTVHWVCIQQALRISFARSLLRICVIVVFVYPSHTFVPLFRSYYNKTGRRYCIMRCHRFRCVRLPIICSCCTRVVRLQAGKRTHVRPGNHILVFFSASKNSHTMRSNKTTEKCLYSLCRSFRRSLITTSQWDRPAE